MNSERFAPLSHVGGLRLLPAKELITTGPVDHADWNYKPVLGWIERRRFKLALSMLPAPKSGRLLELGYGSGVFLPELAARCTALYGLDVHPHADEVMRRLRGHGIEATLVQGTAEAMPYEDHVFDAIVTVSAIEFIPDIDRAVRELHRVLAPTGVLIVVTPNSSPLTDFGLKVMTGESARNDYGDRRAAVVPVLKRWFTVEAERTSPPMAGRLASLHRVLRLLPRRCAAVSDKEERLVGATG